MQSAHESLYPAQMAEEVRGRWEAAGRPGTLPERAVLTRLLDIAYQASLLREEAVAVRCRLMLTPPEELEFAPLTSERPVVCRFDADAVLTAHEVRKLATAAGYYRAVLGVGVDATGGLSIWGMAFTGTHWIDRVDGGRLGGDDLPPRLVI